MNPGAPAYRIDGALVTPERFYAVACDPARHVVVQACAGAGKTWMLVSRIVRALLDGAQPHEVLAITFTRKAAGEMRTRLAEWLRAFAQMDRAQREDELRQRGLNGATAAAQADALAALYERVLASGRAVEVRTFHAWFSQLLRAAPLDLLAGLGLQPEMELIEDLDDLRAPLLRRFHAAVLDDAALLADYRTQAVLRGRSHLLKWLDTAWSKRVELELADAAGTLEPSVEPACTHFASCASLGAGDDPASLLRAPHWSDAARALARALAARGKSLSTQAAHEIDAALAAQSDRARFDGLWQALFTDKGTPRKQLGNLPQQAALGGELESLRAAIDQHDAHLEHGRMLRLSRLLFTEYAALKRSRGLVDMADLESVALALLRDSALSGWVQERLDARVRHLLIDEFQDTSPLQWHALHGWLAAYAGAGGGPAAPSVFIVGDPKQSIYRFRRAEPRVFEAAQRFVVEGLGGQLAECDHTRRNAPGVLHGVNTVFDALAAQGLYPGWHAHTTASADNDAPPLLSLPAQEREARARSEGVSLEWRPSLTVPRHTPEVQRREAEAHQVALAVHTLVTHEGLAPGQIMVLCRKRESLLLAADALRALALPYAAPQDTLLSTLTEVQDLLAVLDVLASNTQALSLARALKSPLFGADDDDLQALAAAARADGGWWAALQGIAAGQGRPALRRAASLLAAWSAAAPTLPPHDLLDRIVHQGDLMARLAAALAPSQFALAQDAVHALLATALQLDGARYATPYNFVRALRSRRVKVPATARADAVQLLTIHGAKGLEARAVFVMDTEPEPRNPDSATLLIDWPVEAAQPRRAAFVASQARCPPSLQDLWAAELAAREREELNGLYVAMTRARERLVFSRTPPSKSSPTPSWWSRVEALAPLWQPQPVAAAQAAVGTTVAVSVLPTLVRSAPSVQARTDSEDRSDDSAARLGQAVHRLLEWATRAPVPAINRAALAQAAAAEFALDDAAAVLAIAARVLDSPHCARFLGGPSLRWAGNEVPLAGAGQVQRIDRLVQLDDGGASVWWVLDYKLASDPLADPALVAQLGAYRDAVRALQPGDAVRAAFITGQGEVVELD